MQFGPYSLLPPLVAIVLAVLTRRVVGPLAAGVFVGAMLLASQLPDARWWTSGQIFLVSLSTSVSDFSHLQVFAFTLLLGAMVGVLEAGGGMHALIAGLSRRVQSRRGAQTMIAISGLLIFFDDYANTLLLGGTMRSTADRYRISRAKLAYLVDSTAAPVAGLSVVSTWAATEISYMAEGLAAGGVDDSSAAFELFIQSIPYRFYPWLALVMVFLVSLSGRDLGPMRLAESSTSSHPSNEDKAADVKTGDKWLGWAALLPVVFCLIAVGGVLVVTGLRSVSEGSMLGPLRLAGEVLGNGDSYLALIVGGAIGWITAVITHTALGGRDWSVVRRGSRLGATQMLPALLILWLAWALSAMTNEESLDTGGYLASVLTDRLDPRLLPTAVFLTAGLVAFSTGTSWGTMGILTPLSIALAMQLDPDGGSQGVICLATCGSVLAGSIFGDHCSPISDTTVLSSRACECDHIQHVRTQMPYAILVAAVCVVTGTLPVAIGLSPWIALLAGAVVLLAVLRIAGRQHQMSPAEAD